MLIERGTLAESDLKRDCRHVRWDRPCTPHKRRGKRCADCDEYAPIRHRVLMVKLAATGDVLRTTAFLPAIHATWPAAHVTWVTAPAAVDLFRGNDLVDEVLGTASAVTVAKLSAQQFDVVLCPDADPDAAALATLARTAEHRGFRMDDRGHVEALGPGAAHWLGLGLDDECKRQNRRTYQALVAEVLGLDPAAVAEPMLQPAAADVADAAAFRRALGFHGVLVGLNTGAGGRWAYKQWTLAHQHEFLRQITALGHGVLLLGGPEEVERHRQLLDSAADLPVFDCGNHNSYSRFAALLQLCKVVVTSDSLAVHVAAARRVPAVVLFGPTSAAEIELYGRGSKITPPGLDCLCCYLPRCDKVPHCQALIEPAVVVDAVRQWLSAAAATRD